MNFLGLSSLDPVSHSKDDLKRISKLLNEPLSKITSIFSVNPLSIRNGPDIFRALDFEKTVMFCPLCAENGYHSKFHEVPLLRKCVLHQVDLERFTGRTTGSNASIYMNGLRTLMQARCTAWPNLARPAFYIHNGSRVENVRTWIEQASKAAVDLSASEIWSVDEARYESHRREVGKLLALVPASFQVKNLLSHHEASWALHWAPLSSETEAELARFGGRVAIDSAYQMFKEIHSVCSIESGLTSHLRGRVKDLQDRHGEKCRCIWRLRHVVYDKWNWVRVDHRMGSNSRGYCPFEVAVDRLRENAGHPDDNRSIKTLEGWFRTFDEDCEELAEKGLCKRVNRIRYFDRNDSPLPFFGNYLWMGKSDLTKLFDRISVWEVERLFLACVAWLDRIDALRDKADLVDEDDLREASILSWRDPEDSVHVCSVKQRLALAWWSRAVRTQDNKNLNGFQ